jgi:transposase
VVDARGLPIRLGLSAGQDHDSRLALELLAGLEKNGMVLADRAYDSDAIREFVRQHGAWANIPPKRNRKDPICVSPYLYQGRNHVERFFNKIKSRSR